MKMRRVLARLCRHRLRPSFDCRYQLVQAFVARRRNADDDGMYRTDHPEHRTESEEKNERDTENPEEQIDDCLDGLLAQKNRKRRD